MFGSGLSIRHKLDDDLDISSVFELSKFNIA